MKEFDFKLFIKVFLYFYGIELFYKDNGFNLFLL